jgi:hypothetical protein
MPNYPRSAPPLRYLLGRALIRTAIHNAGHGLRMPLTAAIPSGRHAGRGKVASLAG